jgi:hypothetical protein
LQDNSKTYVPRIRGDQQRLFKAEDRLRTQPLRLVEIGKLTPGFGIGGDRVEQLD